MGQGSKMYRWVKVFNNGPSKICGRQPLKHFTWSSLEYLDLNVVVLNAQLDFWQILGVEVTLSKTFAKIHIKFRAVCMFKS